MNDPFFVAKIMEPMVCLAIAQPTMQEITLEMINKALEEPPISNLHLQLFKGKKN